MSVPALQAFKQAFHSAKTHLNNAGLAPISRPARDKLCLWADYFYQDGYFSDAEYAAECEQVRHNLALLIGCSPSRVAFFSSTAVAISQVAFSFPLGPRDEVLMFDQEYGSNLFPWREACLRSGALLRLVPSGRDLSAPLDALLGAISAKTRVVAISSVQYQSGAVADLDGLVKACRDRGIFVCVDAMQSIGLMPMDMDALGLDAVAGGSHKWLTSPVGVGYLGVSERLANLLKPLSVGAQSYGSCDLPTQEVCELMVDLSRLEPGSKASAEIIALGASVEMIQNTGVVNILSEVERLANRLCQGLLVAGYRLLCTHGQDAPVRGSIVNFGPGATSKRRTNIDIIDALNGVGIRAVLRGGGVRLSPHAFNSDEDIETALFALR